MTPLRALVVDDHGPSRLLFRRVLEGKGHLVEEADDGLDGVRKALAWKPDVAVVDLDMPIVDGYGVARRLRQALGRGVRLITLTGLDGASGATAAGFDVFLKKPADPEQVCSVVGGGLGPQRPSARPVNRPLAPLPAHRARLPAPRAYATLAPGGDSVV
jgi:CheY-like chemotaxis protein